MKLRLPSLKEGENPLNETLDPGQLQLDAETWRSPVRVTGSVDNETHLLDVRMHIETVGHFVCDRCAIEYDRPVQVDDRVEVLKRDPLDSEEEEAEGLLFLGLRGTQVDLSQEIVDAILLDLPLQNLCRPDCKGLCPICYQDWIEGTCEHFAEYGPGQDSGSDDENNNDND